MRSPRSLAVMTAVTTAVTTVGLLACGGETPAPLTSAPLASTRATAPAPSAPLANVASDASDAGSHLVPPPSLRGNCGVSVNGRLPTEVVDAIIHAHYDRFRLCYDAGLKQAPMLQGRVSVRFVIDRAGAVSYAQDGGSDLPDQSVVQCIVSAMRTLTFPAPEGGVVSVAHPFVFGPSDGGAP